MLRSQYLSGEAESSPSTGLKDVPGPSSARLEVAPWGREVKDTHTHTHTHTHTVSRFKSS